MEFTLKSADNLLRIFAPHTYTPAEQMVSTLIYSGSRNGTLQVMKVVNEARKTRLHEYEPEDKFIRHFHSCTEDNDKRLNMEDYMEGVFPVVSTSMVLGLGQNLKRVRCIIHMGRGDPSAIVQMVGRCRRGGNGGIALLPMEKERKNGKNSLTDCDDKSLRGEDTQMDALALTPVCLQVALTLDNLVGYIPMSFDDPHYQAEVAREAAANFPPCDCSNCKKSEADAIISNIQQMTVDNFHAFWKDPLSIQKDESLKVLVRKKKFTHLKPDCSYPLVVASHLAGHLELAFGLFYYETLGPEPKFLPSDFFGTAQATAIVDHINTINQHGEINTKLIEHVIGGQMFSGQVDLLGRAIKEWLQGEFFQNHLKNEAAHLRFVEDEVNQLQKQREEYLRQHAIDVKEQATKRRKTIAAQKAKMKNREAQEGIMANDAERKARSVARTKASNQKQASDSQSKAERRWKIAANKATAQENRSKREAGFLP
ncbi:hypothetical protein PCANC_00917 [Puccinia coronata f. sp. avenae]|uniref:DNA 3'-5' helicase n=1 Tax=Puccinia coronata f. sp. avenae TaxID=200324 RepID=A0A2N5W7P7_9BASI|nr:hypothetical protein PCANC_00917 [Puccinia coronata f. sp. avenae]